MPLSFFHISVILVIKPSGVNFLIKFKIPNNEIES